MESTWAASLMVPVMWIMVMRNNKCMDCDVSVLFSFEFRRLGLEVVDGFEAVQSFELSLSRPIGINVEGELGCCSVDLAYCLYF